MDISYRQVKDIKIKERRLNISRYNIYRHFSAPFTYLFLRFGISPSDISIINFFPNLAGFLFLSVGAYSALIFGLCFFILYKILDCSDGEVARIINPKVSSDKYKNIEGEYFDAAGHFIEPICLGVGLGIGLFLLYNHWIYLVIGTILAITFNLEYALAELNRSYFREAVIEKGIRKKDEMRVLQKRLELKMNDGKSWESQSLFVRLFGIYPFEGLFFSREFIVPVLLVISLIEFYWSFMGYPFMQYGIRLGFLSLYVIMLCVVKLIKISSFIMKLRKNRYITAFVEDLK